MNPPVLVVQTGTANTASVLAGFRRLDAAPRISSRADEVRRADRVVLPGVGAFAAAIQELARQGLVDALRERVQEGRPTLAICLGLQLFCEQSEESPEAEGLGVVPGTVARFPDHVPVPQLGWNRIDADPSCEVLADGCYYFANSYRLADAPAGWRVARADHGGSFVAALERGPVVACQFHPELSGALGGALLGRWLTSSGVAC